MYLNFILFILFQLNIQIFNNARVNENKFFNKTFGSINKFKLLNNIILFVTLKVKLSLVFLICYLFVAIYSLNIFSIIILILSIYLIVINNRIKIFIEIIAILYFYLNTLNIFFSILIALVLIVLLLILLKSKVLYFELSLKFNITVKSIIMYITTVISYIVLNNFLSEKIESFNYFSIIITFAVIVASFNYLIIKIEDNKKISNTIYNRLILKNMSSNLNPFNLYSAKIMLLVMETIVMSLGLYSGYLIVNNFNTIVKPIDILFYLIISILYTNDLLIYKYVTNFSFIYNNKITKLITDTMIYAYLISLFMLPLLNQYIYKEYDTKLGIDNLAFTIKIVIFVILLIVFIYRYYRLFKIKNWRI